jgi:hypothetical protein
LVWNIAWLTFAGKFQAHATLRGADAWEASSLPLKAIAAVRYIPKFAVAKIMIAQDQ